MKGKMFCMAAAALMGLAGPALGQTTSWSLGSSAQSTDNFQYSFSVSAWGAGFFYGANWSGTNNVTPYNLSYSMSGSTQTTQTQQTQTSQAIPQIEPILSTDPFGLDAFYGNK